MPIEKLIQGFQSFRASYYEDNPLYEKLVKEGQNPETLVIACSDSRNDPALLTGSKPGDLFVVRNVAAIVPPYQPDDGYHGTSAAIEFAVKGLKVKNIIVLGHALCGGVQTLSRYADRDMPGFEFLSRWMRIGLCACQAVGRVLPDAPEPVRLRALEQALILTSLENLKTFPWIREGLERGTLSIHGWYFDMVNGALLEHDADSGSFVSVTSPDKACAS